MNDSTKPNCSKADFDEFVKQFSAYLANAKESKRRGNNDYNPLKAVQKVNDEEKMHSGFLHSLLDTRGEHYQDDLFLKLFLQNVEFDKWFGDTKNAQVFKEYKNIDIYITNGEKHIIIENKINSGDENEQIARYIKTIHDKNLDDNESDDIGVEYENIAVIYLSPNGRKPNEQSLTLKDESIEWIPKEKDKVLECEIENKKIFIKYRQISYEKDIMAWIEKCQKEVGNIINLNSALEFYKDIVKIITNQKESKMSIAEFFKEKKDFGMAFEISNNIDKIAEEYLRTIIYENLQKSLNEEQWVIEIIDTDNGISIYEKQYEWNEQPIFYFYFYWYQNNRGPSRFWCSILLDVPPNQIKQLSRDLKCDFYKFDDNIIVLKSHAKDFGNIDFISLENELLNFIKDKNKLLSELNKKFKECYKE